MNQGKDLETLVSQIEKLLLPTGFQVSANDKVYNDEGVQIAEFDIEISGKIGSGQIRWLIECRDRPNHGPAPGSWIEQLVGRRQRFRFDKVTAVSTTGFSAGAAEYAREAGIELRTVSLLTQDDIIDWFPLKYFTLIKRQSFLKEATLYLNDESQENVAAFKKFMANLPANEAFLISTETGEACTIAEAFSGVVSQNEDLLDDLEPDQGEKEVHTLTHYPDDKSHFVVAVEDKLLRIKMIRFLGIIKKVSKQVPVTSIRRYLNGIDETISQSVTFSPPENFFDYNLEFHKVEATGETHVLLRRKSK